MIVLENGIITDIYHKQKLMPFGETGAWFFKGNRAHTYLGPIDDAEAEGKGEGDFAVKRYPDFVMIAQGYGCGAASVSKKSDLAAAINEMIEHDGPFVLDVEVPYQEQVLPMIPSNHTVDDMIID